MNILTLAGVALLIFAYLDFKSEETNAGLISSWLYFIKISREETPMMYWALISFEVGLGLAGIFLGLRH